MTLFKKSKNKHDFFIQLFMQIVIFVFLAVVILTSILYGYSSSSMLNVLYKSNLSVFSQVSNTVNQMNDTLRAQIASISTNDKISSLMYSNHISLADANEAFRQIRYTINANPLIYSVYIYNARSDMYYITGQRDYIRQSTFFDTQIKDVLENLKDYNLANPIPRSIPQSELYPDDKVNVLTYISPESYYDNDGNKNAIIINVLADDYLKYVSIDTQNQSFNQMFFIDDIGTIVVHQNQDEFLKNIADQPYINKILLANDVSNHFVSEVYNTKSIISYIRLHSSNWILVNVTPYKYISSSINFFKVSVITIALLVLIMCILFGYYISKRIYDPLGNIFNKIYRIKPKPEDNDSKSLTNMANYIDNITSELNFLDNFKRNNEFFVKNENLKKFLYDPMADSYTQMNFNFICQSNVANQYMICIYKIDNFENYNRNLTYEDQFLYKYAFINIAQEITQQYFPCELIDVNSDHIVAIMNILGKTSVSATIKKIAAEIQREYLKYFDISVSVFVSDKVKSIFDITNAYKSTFELSFYRIIYGQGCFLTHSDIDNASLQTEIITYEKTKPLIDCINLGKLSESLVQLDSLTELLKTFYYANLMASVGIVSASIFQAISNVESKLTINFATFTNEINHLETLDKIRDNFASLIQEICYVKKNARSNKADNMITAMREYIKINYADENMSSKTVADYINLSTRYISKVFYENTGKTIQAYINEYRIEIAKDMLKNTNCNIEEILKKVGWPNLKYFYTVFKKHTGLTPSEFRKNNRL